VLLDSARRMMLPRATFALEPPTALLPRWLRRELVVLEASEGGGRGILSWTQSSECDEPVPHDTSRCAFMHGCQA
jgi:hypothetical protein